MSNNDDELSFNIDLPPAPAAGGGGVGQKRHTEDTDDAKTTLLPREEGLPEPKTTVMASIDSDNDDKTEILSSSPSWTDDTGYVTYTLQEQMLLSVQTPQYRVSTSYLGFMQSKPHVDLSTVLQRTSLPADEKNNTPKIILAGAAIIAVGAVALGAWTIIGHHSDDNVDATTAPVATTTAPGADQDKNTLAPGTGTSKDAASSAPASPSATPSATPSPTAAEPPKNKDGRSLLPDKITGNPTSNGVTATTFDTGSMNYVQPQMSPDGKVEGNPHATPPKDGFTGNTGGGPQHMDLGYMSKYSIDQQANPWKSAMAGTDSLIQDWHLTDVLGDDIDQNFYDNARTFSSGYTAYPLGKGIWMVMGNGEPYALLQCGAPGDVKERFDSTYGSMLQQEYGACSGYSFDVMPDKVKGSQDASKSPEDWYYTDPK